MLRARGSTGLKQGSANCGRKAQCICLSLSVKIWNTARIVVLNTMRCGCFHTSTAEQLGWRQDGPQSLNQVLMAFNRKQTNKKLLTFLPFGSTFSRIIELLLCMCICCVFPDVYGCLFLLIKYKYIHIPDFFLVMFYYFLQSGVNQCNYYYVAV